MFTLQIYTLFFVFVLFASCTQNQDIKNIPNSANDVEVKNIFVIPDAEKLKKCTQDVDCIKIMTACSCSCGSAINNKFAEYFEQKLKAFCEKHPPEKQCKMVCSGRVQCFKGSCEYL